MSRHQSVVVYGAGRTVFYKRKKVSLNDRKTKDICR
nr:MAG TPA: hypothetical protein [Caudoviricetes sp.]